MNGHIEAEMMRMKKRDDGHCPFVSSYHTNRFEALNKMTADSTRWKQYDCYYYYYAMKITDKMKRIQVMKIGIQNGKK